MSEHTCPHTGDDYRNKEGWLRPAQGRYICLDWDAACTKCREGLANDEEIFEFALKGRDEG